MEDEVQVEEQLEQGAESTQSQEPTPAETHEDPAEALRAMREDSDRNREQAAFFRKLALSQTGKRQPSKQTIDKDPNEYLTAGEAKAFDERFAQIEDRQRSQHDALCEERARAKFPDFDEVIFKHVLPIVEAQKAMGDFSLMNAIDNAEDPALAAYYFGRSSETYAAQSADRSKATTQKVVSKIEENLNKPGTLGSVKSASPSVAKKSYSEMDSKEFAEARRALGL